MKGRRPSCKKETSCGSPFHESGLPVFFRRKPPTAYTSLYSAVCRDSERGCSSSTSFSRPFQTIALIFLMSARNSSKSDRSSSTDKRILSAATLTEQQNERKRTDDRCSGVYFVSRLSQSCASQVPSVSRCKNKGSVQLMVTSARLLCKMRLSVHPTLCGHHQRDWALPQARARSSYHAQRNLSHPPRTEVAPSLSPNTQYWKTLRIC